MTNARHTLSATEEKFLREIAKARPFWAGHLAKADQWKQDDKIGLFADMLDRLREDMDKFPNFVGGSPVRNKKSKEGTITCWRRDCKERATVAVGGVAVCGSHEAAQREDAASYTRKKEMSAALADQHGESDAD